MPPQTLDDLRHSDSTNNSKTPANTMVSDDGSVALLVGLLLREGLLSDGMAVHAAYAHTHTISQHNISCSDLHFIFMVDADLSWIGCACMQKVGRSQNCDVITTSSIRGRTVRTAKILHVVAAVFRATFFLPAIIRIGGERDEEKEVKNEDDVVSVSRMVASKEDHRPWQQIRTQQ